MEKSEQIANDLSNRGAFISGLVESIKELAQIPSDNLATPRVLAVDANWGSGKTWLANELVKRLKKLEYKVSYIDAFRHDHHDDAFAVIASSIYEVLKPQDEVKRNFLKATGAVLKAAAPVLIKAALKTGATAFELTGAADAVMEAAKEAANPLSDAAVEKIFGTYSSTERVQRKFIQSLSECTKELKDPLVVVIDELDRCRPTFALEMLERIKHLFDADNVVFVVFWNSHSICQSILHTYGGGTDAQSYLSKFVAFGISPELPAARSRAIGARYETFVIGVSQRLFPENANSLEFIDSFRNSCGILQPSLREVQRALQVANITKAYLTSWAVFASYLILLKSVSETRFRRVLEEDAASAEQEAELFLPFLTEHADGYQDFLHGVLKFITDKNGYEELLRRKRLISRDDTAANNFSPEKLKLLTATSNGKFIEPFLETARKVSKSEIFSKSN